jgi:hypothetical protein
MLGWLGHVIKMIKQTWLRKLFIVNKKVKGNGNAQPEKAARYGELQQLEESRCEAKAK